MTSADERVVTVRLSGQAITGGSTSCTSTRNTHVCELSEVSTAVNVSVVVPMGKKLSRENPAGCELWDTTRRRWLLSLVVMFHVTWRVLLPALVLYTSTVGVVALSGVGQPVNTGFSRSVTVTVTVAVAQLKLASLAEKVVLNTPIPRFIVCADATPTRS